MTRPAFERVLRDDEVGWKAKDGKRLADLRLRALGYSIADTVGYIVGGCIYPPSRDDGGKFGLALGQGPDGRWLTAADLDNANAIRRSPDWTTSGRSPNLQGLPETSTFAARRIQWPR